MYQLCLSILLCVICSSWGSLNDLNLPDNFSKARFVGDRQLWPCLVAHDQLFCERFEGMYLVEKSNVRAAVCEGIRCFTLICDYSSSCSIFVYRNEDDSKATTATLLWNNFVTTPDAHLAASSDVVLLVDPNLRTLRMSMNGTHFLQVLPATVPSISIYGTAMSASNDVAVIIDTHNSTPSFELLYYRYNGNAAWQLFRTIRLEIPLFQPSLFVYMWSSTIYVISDGKLLSSNLSQATVTWTTELTFDPNQAQQLERAVMVRESMLIVQYSSREECFEVHEDNGTAWAYVGASCGVAPITDLDADDEGFHLNVLREASMTSLTFSSLHKGYLLDFCQGSVFDCPSKTTTTTSTTASTTSINISAWPASSASPRAKAMGLSQRLQTMLIAGGAGLFVVLCTVGLLIYRYHRTRSERLYQNMLVRRCLMLRHLVLMVL
jgi:hypothetical protein